MNHKSLALIVTILVATQILIAATQAAVINYDKTGTVTSVIDGATFTINTGETIKLAELTVPASGEAGFETSRSYLENLIIGKTVYLDVDTLLVSDHGKLPCLVYIDFNSSCYENINKAMLEANYAAPTTTRTTEFNPSTWTWFIAKETTTPTPTPAVTPTVTVTASPTPFTAPTPSVSPDVSTPTATPTTPATTNTPQNSAIENTWIYFAAAIIIVIAVVLGLFIIKRK